MNISYFFLGKVSVSADYKNATGILNICMFYKIPYTNFCTNEHGISLCFKAADYKKFKKRANEYGIKLTIESKRGVPFVFDRYKYRYGILAGIVLSFALVLLSQKFVWSVNVTGNEILTSSEIINTLDKYGFRIGSYIPKVNTDRIENKLLIESDVISWISINISGTHAEVEVREYEKGESNIEYTGAANLVAKKSGVIQDVKIYKGNVVVSSGQYVEKGDLLVSGLYDSNILGFRYTRAQGEVAARTTNEFYIDIPYEYTTYEYTGEEYYDKYLNFFDYSINISKNSGNVGAFYDKIDMVENYCLFGYVSTPFSYRTVKYAEYVEKTAYRTETEAEELAYFELSKRLSEMSEDSIILRKTIIPRVDEDSFSIFCTVVAIEDIAEVSEFEVDLGIDGGNEGVN